MKKYYIDSKKTTGLKYKDPLMFLLANYNIDLIDNLYIKKENFNSNLHNYKKYFTCLWNLDKCIYELYNINMELMNKELNWKIVNYENIKTECSKEEYLEWLEIENNFKVVI